MPELPEIVAHAERLSAAFSGIPLERFEPLHPAVLKTFNPRPDAVAGETLNSVGHRGKFLLLRFGSSSGEIRAAVDATGTGNSSAVDHIREQGSGLVFVVHLMQAGRLRSDAVQALKPRNGMARWRFADSSALLLTEAGKERRAGVWLIDGEPEECEPLARLGPDADSIGCDELALRLSAASERVHGFLRDQSHLAGIGRLLANEILHSAKISPFANTSRFEEEAVERLHQAISTSIERGLAAERELEDMGRSKNRPNDVHHRVGQQCPNCEDKVRAVEYRRYRVAYCPTCQTGGKALADNTTSRFLK